MSAQVPIEAQCTERRARPLLNKGSTFLKNFLKMKIAALAPAAVQAYRSLEAVVSISPTACRCSIVHVGAACNAAM
jgi:hypothetical protein